MNYSELVDAVMAWANKPEIEQSIPTFIALAEAQMNRDLAENGISGSVVRASVSLGGEYLGTPNDMGRPLSLHIGATRLQNVTEQSLDLLAAQEPSLGQPKAFTVIGAEFRFTPVPDTAYAALLVYEATLDPLGPSNPSNWLLDAYPDAYLYGTLAQTAPFLGDDARLTTWANLYATVIAGVAKAERAKRGTQDSAAYRPNLPYRRRHGGLC